MLFNSSFEARIHLRSFNVINLDILKAKLKQFAKKKKLKYSSINLPVDKKKITVLKSPHVNKKARDQFELSVFNRLIILKGSDLNRNIYCGLHRFVSEDVLVKLIVKNV